MQQSSVVKVGNFEVPVTPSLRELFSHTHAEMSGARPADPQYPHSEQHEMYLACEVTLKDDKSKIDTKKTEENVLELIHFLNENGVAIPDILGGVQHCGIRCFGPLTRSVAMRLHLKEVRLRQARESSELVFIEPELESAVA